jgi:hypothetical protein
MSDEREPTPEVLRRLEERLDQASEKAQRLVVEAAEAALRAAPRPPAAGWQAPGSEEVPGAGDSLAALIGAARALRDLVPPELQRRLTDALRELLLAVRALIDWYVERLERRDQAPDEVQDIPIL